MWMFGDGGMGPGNGWFEDDGKLVLQRPGDMEGLKKFLGLYTDEKVSPEASANGSFYSRPPTRSMLARSGSRSAGCR